MSKPVELLGQARGVEEKIAPETVFIFKHFPLIKKQKNQKKKSNIVFTNLKYFQNGAILKIPWKLTELTQFNRELLKKATHGGKNTGWTIKMLKFRIWASFT